MNVDPLYQTDTFKPLPKPATFWDKVKGLLQKVWEVVKLIFYVLIGAVLFLANPSLFAIGLASGVVFDKKYKEVSAKITRIYNESQWKLLTLIGFGAFLSLPVTAAFIALGYGANLGYTLLNQKKQIKNRELGEVVVV